MARNSLFYLCKVCNKTHRSDVVPAMTVCEPDHDDMVALRSLYTTIVAKHKSLRTVPIGKVMTRLWAWYEKQNPPAAGQAETPRPAEQRVHVDELKDIF